ncbi:hypothetical protein HHL23_19555 [Chryseobacterium sp. RP-3-3]|uniref:Uncharacterized protein n=1 Tax=Chryseobacterium antibioticum TaxID=2728847 RepID=A0A7Y0AR59_9FLAO|nr:hypothetical protein [Chryseobacterium antibioticum]NML71976.1 hypothetical protein [Chryseobacterium antibioticum]
MKITYFLLALVFCFIKVSAQVGIAKTPGFEPDTRALLHVKQDNNAARMPRANTAVVLPTSAVGTTGNGTQGSIIFNRETGSIVQNDGTVWKISDPIVTSLKNNKMARFIRSAVVTADCGTCGLGCGGVNRLCPQAGGSMDVPFTSSSPSYNDISADVSLASATSNIINIKTRGLYKISFKSGAIDVKTPALCVGVTINLYSKVDLETSTAAAPATWRPITNNTTSSTSGALSLGSLTPGAIDVGQSLVLTYIGSFEAGDNLRLRFYGNQNIGTGICTGIIGGNVLSFSMNTTGNGVSEIIVEKINMQ